MTPLNKDVDIRKKNSTDFQYEHNKHVKKHFLQTKCKALLLHFDPPLLECMEYDSNATFCEEKVLKHPNTLVRII